METHYTYQPSQDERKAIFMASCIESVAKQLDMTSEDVYVRMQKIDLIEGYILPCYDVLHSESRQNVTDDIIRTMTIWEQKKGIKA